MHLSNVLYYGSLILEKKPNQTKTKQLIWCFLDLYNLTIELFPSTQPSRCSPVFNPTANLCQKMKLGGSTEQKVFVRRTGRKEL